MNLFEEHAREKLGKPPEWRAFRYECLPANSWKTTHVAITGEICLNKANGAPQWNCPLDEPEQVIISLEEHDKWTDEWAKTTGKCPRCCGSGQRVKRVSVVDGTEYIPCAECDGTGKHKS